MKNIIKFIVVTFIIFQSCFYLYSAPQNIDSIKNNKTSIKLENESEQLDSNCPWRSSPYLAVGYGYPQGIRFETGYNISRYFSFGFTVGLYNFWAKHPYEASFGLVGRSFIPDKSLKFIPYFLLAYGERFSFFDDNDKYTIISIGTMITLTKWLQLRPELGFDMTSKYISGGKGYFGYSSPEVREDKAWFCFNLSLEIDVISIFR